VENDTENDEIANLCFMGHMGHTKKNTSEITYSDSDSGFKPSYKELQEDIEEMHCEALNSINKIISQKKNILKLENELAHLKSTFENLKQEHASLVNEKLINPCLDSPKKSSPKYDPNWMNFASCETSLSLYKEIEILTHKLEYVSKEEMKFVMKSKENRKPFKRPYKKYAFVNKNDNDKPYTQNDRCHYCGRLRHNTPHCHIRKVEVLKGVMM